MRLTSPPLLMAMDAATTTINTPNRRRSFCPSVFLPIVEPIDAPTIPQTANTIATGQYTLPRRAWSIMLMQAFKPTATALVPMATWGDCTPTT